MAPKKEVGKNKPNVTEFVITGHEIGEEIIFYAECGCGHRSRIKYGDVLKELKCMHIGEQFEYLCGRCLSRGHVGEIFFIILKTGKNSFKLLEPVNLKIIISTKSGKKPRIAGKKQSTSR